MIRSAENELDLLNPKLEYIRECLAVHVTEIDDIPFIGGVKANWNARRRVLRVPVKLRSANEEFFTRNMTVDTGASRTCVTLQTVTILGLSFGPAECVKMADGEEKMKDTVQLSLCFDDNTIRTTTAFVMGMDLLGMDILQHYTFVIGTTDKTFFASPEH